MQMGIPPPDLLTLSRLCFLVIIGEGRTLQVTTSGRGYSSPIGCVYDHAKPDRDKDAVLTERVASIPAASVAGYRSRWGDPD